MYFDSIDKCEIEKMYLSIINQGCNFYAGCAENDNKLFFLADVLHIILEIPSKDLEKQPHKPIKIEKGCWIGGGNRTSGSYY